MAEIHNPSDLKIIQILQDEHNQVREQLERFPNYCDPTESHAEILKSIFDDVFIVVKDDFRRYEEIDRLRREVSYLKSQIQALETEKQSEKDIVYGYPLVGDWPTGGGFDPSGLSGL